MPDRGLVRRIVVLLLMLGSAPFGDGPHAAGAFIIRSERDPRIVDITDDVARSCTEFTSKTLIRGGVIEVRYASGSEALATSGLVMMERVQTLMTVTLGLSPGSGARLYIVELPDYPPSFTIVDKSPYVPLFSVLNRNRADGEKLAEVRRAVFEHLAHEWSHRALPERYGKRSPGIRARWIEEGFASFVEYAAVRELQPERIFQEEAKRLPLLRLDRMDLETLMRWRFPRRLPPDEPIEDMLEMYGAALGVFLRIEQRGGPPAVLSFLDRLAGPGRLGRARVESALRETAGCEFGALARMSPQEKRSAQARALEAVKSGDFGMVSAGLGVIARVPDLIESHEGALRSVVLDRRLNQALRAEAARVAVDQGRQGTAASLLRQTGHSDEDPLPDTVALPLLLGVAKDSPACSLEGLVRLSGASDASIREAALKQLGDLAGRRMRPRQMVDWMRSKPFGECEREDPAESVHG